MVINDLTTAQLIMRNEQAKWARMVGASPADAAALARSQAEARRTKTLPDGDSLREGPFRYDPSVEQERLDRTDQIIARVDPGPYEDGRYLEFLARQAASVEMAISHELGLDPSAGEALNGILLGTSGAPRSNAVTSSRKGSSAAGVVLSAGMVYLMYQSSKATVTAWVPLDAPTGQLASFGSDIEEVAGPARCRRRPGGTPGRPARVLVPARFTSARALRSAGHGRSAAPAVGHSVCGAVHHRARVRARAVRRHQRAGPFVATAVAADVVRSRGRADVFGALIVALSAGNLDRVGPNIALQGAVMAMRIHEIADEAIAMATGRPLVPSTTHPPFSERIQLVYLALQLLQKLTGDALSPDEIDPHPMEHAVNTVSLIWERAKGRLRDRLDGAALHPIWTAGAGA